MSGTTNVAARRDSTAGGSEISADDAVALLARSGMAFYHWDITSDALTWTRGAVDLLGVASPQEIATGRLYSTLVEPATAPGREAIAERAKTKRSGEFAYQIAYSIRPSAGLIQIEDCGTWTAGGDGRPAQAEGFVRVIGGPVSAAPESQWETPREPVPELLNRTGILAVLAETLERTERENGSCALLIAAIDNLGVLNDSYGFQVADELIAGVATRLSDTMRHEDSLGRLSGNKIAIVLNACTETDLRTAAERFGGAIADAALTTSSGEVAVTISIGAVVLPRHGRTAETALAHGQEALARAQELGPAARVIFEPSRKREEMRLRNLAIAGEVVSALNEGRLELAFQPIVSARNGTPVFHEALCRLHLADGSPVAASDFIEAAERLGIVRLIDHRALDLAVAALREDAAIALSINVSSASALDSSWFTRLAAHLRADRSLAARLVVEITETTAIANLERATEFVRSLKDLGCRVAIDDFGAGHTSFRNLRGLGADFVKIDGSFVDEIADNPDDLFFVSTLVRLARHMGLQTVAEKVARERDAEVLRTVGVNYLQGNIFGAALPRGTAQARARFSRR